MRGAKGAAPTVDQDTRERLLTEAAQLFAARGLARVTVRDICRAAHANVAAINYHFHGKRGLYEAVVQSAIDSMQTTTATIIEAGQGQPPEQRLTTFIAIFLQRVTVPDNWIHQLMVRELNEPTPALDLVVRQVMEPRMTYLGGVIAELLSCRPDDPRVRRSVTSVQLQCLAAIDRRLPLHSVPTTPAAIGDLADHIARFSIGGITALRAPAPRRSPTRPGTRRAPRARPARRPLRP